MIVKLFTQSGGFVHEAMAPDFKVPPDVILWGSRMFVAPAVDHEVREKELQAGELAYVEASAYAIVHGRSATN